MKRTSEIVIVGSSKIVVMDIPISAYVLEAFKRACDHDIYEYDLPEDVSHYRSWVEEALINHMHSLVSSDCVELLIDQAIAKVRSQMDDKEVQAIRNQHGLDSGP